MIANANKSKIAKTGPTKVFTVEEIELQDGTQLNLRPLPIKPLRRVMAVWNNTLEEARKENGEDRDMLDVFSEMGFMALQGLKETADVYESQEDFEDAVDQESLLRIIKVCAGLDFESAPKAAEMTGAGTGTS